MKQVYEARREIVYVVGRDHKLYLLEWDPITTEYAIHEAPITPVWFNRTEEKRIKA